MPTRVGTLAMVGQTVSHYRILEELDSGGLGVVYRAEDTTIHRHVALKFLPEQLSKNRQGLERLQREAQAAFALNPPNICVIHDIDEHEGQPFIAMEYWDMRTRGQSPDGRPFIFDPMRGPMHVYPFEAAFADRNSLCFVTFHFTRQGRQPFLFGSRLQADPPDF